MKRILFVLLAFFFLHISSDLMAQDTLPRFTVDDKGNGRIVVSWSNPYPGLVQLAVQRSYDSLKKFTSVYSSTSPELPVNGFSDKVVPGLKVYYRIFYVMKGGAYYFTNTKSSQGGRYVGGQAVTIDSKRDQLDEEMIKKLSGKKTDSTGNIAPNKQFFIKIKDSLYTVLQAQQFLKFRDSILYQTKDTLFQLTEDTVLLGVYVQPFMQRTSEYVYTDRDGYIVIKLPEAGKKRFDIVFLEEDETPVLELQAVKEPLLILDKTNFYHGGWYKFELRENGKVKERNKIFLAKDF
ncbi:MAG TPA: hypothetical protein VLC98_00760 [Phnomibacter sp.]|nr:hypothetical protein [Phnomibacter sp.]